MKSILYGFCISGRKTMWLMMAWVFFRALVAAALCQAGRRAKQKQWLCPFGPMEWKSGTPENGDGGGGGGSTFIRSTPVPGHIILFVCALPAKKHSAAALMVYMFSALAHFISRGGQTTTTMMTMAGRPAGPSHATSSLHYIMCNIARMAESEPSAPAARTNEQSRGRDISQEMRAHDFSAPHTIYSYIFVRS